MQLTIKACFVLHAHKEKVQKSEQEPVIWLPADILSMWPQALGAHAPHTAAVQAT
jgi:hypothetical protein